MKYRTAATVLALLLLSSFCFAYSVVDFVNSERHFVKGDETLEESTTKIKSGSDTYWVVPIISGETLVTFIPAKTSEKEVSTNRATNRKLFETQYVLRSYLLNQQAVSANPNAQWFVVSSNENKISNLSQLLNNETFELTTIESESDNLQISEQTLLLAGMLYDLSQQALKVSQSMKSVLAIEGLFSLEVETDVRDDLREAFEEVFADMDEFETQALAYNAEVAKLKSYISTSDMTADQKTFLLNLADPPQDFGNIGNWATQAKDLETLISRIYSYSGTTIDGYLDEFEKRLEMDHAYDVLYGPNEDLLELNSEFTSLAAAVVYVLNEQRIPLWNNETAVPKLDTDWRNAERKYNSENYALAEEYAQNAENYVKSIIAAGMKEINGEPFITNELIFAVVAILVVLLIVVYLIQHRGKIKKSGSKEERVDIYGWDRKI